ncbi:MAG: hypothetical protein MZV64_20650 [Ignavibacteriales bacterium]|nr:hypothetical protein [Ignavibacteriales bacterium]
MLRLVQRHRQLLQHLFTGRALHPSRWKTRWPLSSSWKMAIDVDNLDYLESNFGGRVSTHLLVNFDYGCRPRRCVPRTCWPKWVWSRKELPQGILEAVVFKADPSQLARSCAKPGIRQRTWRA